MRTYDWLIGTHGVQDKVELSKEVLLSEDPVSV